MVDFTHITELLRAALNNLLWLEATVKEQITQSLLAQIEQLLLGAFPNLDRFLQCYDTQITHAQDHQCATELNGAI